MKPIRPLPIEVEWSYYGTPRFKRDKVLLVDADSSQAALLASELRVSGFQLITAENGTAALIKAHAALPSVIVIEAGLSPKSGFDVCKQIKADPAVRHIPVILIQAKPTEKDRILGFELGADDFVAKPLSPREMVLRIRNSIRRAEKDMPAEVKMTLGDMVIDPIRHEVTIQNRPVYVTLLEFRLLVLFMENCGRVLDRQTLLNEVWGQPGTAITRTVDTHVRRLRGRLGSWSRHVESVRGNGYRMNLTIPAFSVESIAGRTRGPGAPYFRSRTGKNRVQLPPYQKKFRTRKSVGNTTILVGAGQG